MNFIKKYEPETLNDFDFEEKYFKTINGFIEKDFLNLIIVGSRGTGKTALLNAMIKRYFEIHNTIINEKYDIFRINSLKDNGITFYRTEVKNFCQMQSRKKKLLVVDDLEMIDKQIQTIFKYYLEKWGTNIFFIATTCDIDKVNSSLQSNTYQLTLNPKSDIVLESILNKIVINNKMIIKEPAKKYIIKQCDGVIKMLFMFIQKIFYLDREITISVLEDNFTMIPVDNFESFFKWSKSGNFKELFALIKKFVIKGFSIGDIFDEFFHFIKSTSMFDEEMKYKLIELISKYILIVNTSHDEEIELYFFTNNVVALFNKNIEILKS